MAKIAKNPKRSLFFWGYFSILKQFDSKHSSVIDSTFGIKVQAVWLFRRYVLNI